MPLQVIVPNNDRNNSIVVSSVPYTFQHKGLYETIIIPNLVYDNKISNVKQ